MKDEEIILRKIKHEILRIVEKDQALRYSNKVDLKVDKTNANKLKKIVSKIGWPTISLVGKKASEGAWLLVQHAVHDLKFQKKCLALIKKAAKNNDVDIKLIPLLEDRIRVQEGKKQIYGTQFFKDDKTGESVPKPINNIKKVETLRASFGLESFEAYSRKLNDMVEQIEKNTKK